jgi:Icc-related predicted phosphoesterase
MAFSDVHSPLYTNEVLGLIEKHCAVSGPDIIVVAGDIVDRGKWQAASYLERINELCKPSYFIGVFGNDDFPEIREKIKELTPSVKWLDDENLGLTVKNLSFRIHGSTGILDEPTNWQSKNIPNIREIYRKRLDNLKSFCEQSEDDSINIVVMHYPPTYTTMLGEPSWAWKQMGSRKAEEILVSLCKHGYVFHGHAHNSKRLQHTIGDITFTNVAYPARKDVFFTLIKPKVSLDKYLLRDKQ